MSKVKEGNNFKNEIKFKLFRGTIRKFMITDICEYFKIVEQLDEENIKYYVYA